MDRVDIHDCGRDTYCIALAIYKIQFKEIRYLEVINIVDPSIGLKIDVFSLLLCYLTACSLGEGKRIYIDC